MPLNDLKADPSFSLWVRLITTYQKIYDAIHARSGQAVPVKQIYIKTDTESCLGWVSNIPTRISVAI